ncbi:MAG: DNA mismatch repair endonuclease MutL [Flavobacteriales bacterium]|nr:DNA mismatch repair endonuclease MutL [Flavobacteriales bacterium]
MPEVIRQLPEIVANQIAAGEVVQRPASAVKELMENAVDAGASRIEVRVVDAGRTSIQVVDNGVGMIPSDAKRCFDRHATSKISTAEDLYSIVSKGFRGEAMASIASISHVELKTRHADEELGFHRQLEGGKLTEERACALEVGTTVSVKHLFFNVPARRNFLKSDAVELRHVLDEFQRVALAHETIHFLMFHNGSELFNLRPGTRRQRVVGVFGSKYDERLVPIEESTDVVSVAGFVGKPAFARRSRGEQFLFVNQRFVKHHVLNRVIMDAYEGLLPSGQYPLYVLFLTIDPARLDVNIHPTKTEVKFDEDRYIQALLLPAIRRGLGKYAVAPSLDFDQETAIDVQPLDVNRSIPQPEVRVNLDYNPFHEPRKSSQGSGSLRPSGGQIDAWKTLYGEDAPAVENLKRANPWEVNETTKPLAVGITPGEEMKVEQDRPMFQFQQRYIVASTRSGMLLIDQNRAHQRVLYESLVIRLEASEPAISTQQLLFPERVTLSVVDREFMLESAEWLAQLGLHFTAHEDGIEITGLPAEGEATPQDLVEAVLLDREEESAEISRAERVAAQMARTLSVKPGKSLTSAEMADLLDRLFGCSTPGLDPFGRVVIVTFGLTDIEQRFR